MDRPSEVPTTGKNGTDPSWASAAAESPFQSISISGGAEVHHNHQGGGRETQQYHISFSWWLLCRTIGSLAVMLLTFIPAAKHVLDKKVINALTVGMIVKWVMSTLVQFITGSELYTAAYEALRVRAANMDVLVISVTTEAYFYSAYSSLRAAFSEDFKGTDFFVINSMFITFILLRKSLKVTGDSQNEDGVSHINAIPPPFQSLQTDEPLVQKFADWISKCFVPLVIILSFSTWFAWLLVGILHGYPKSWFPSSMSNFELALQFEISITLIACSCALELTAPTTTMVANGIAEFQGLMIKGDEALETTHKVDCIIFGRGILTKLVVDDVKLPTNIDRQEFLFLIAAIEMKSEHPIATAIVEYAKTHDKQGHGVEGKVQNKIILVGNHRLMSEKGINIPSCAKKELSEAERKGQTGILVSVDGEVVGVLVISDQVKPDATPEDKANEVGELQASGYTVAMVGQDMNDSAALKAADVLLKKLEDVLTTIDLCRQTIPYLQLIRFWAFVYTLLAIPVAAGGLIPLAGFRSVPLISAAGIASSSVDILFSIHMLKKYKKPRNLSTQELHEIKTE